MGAVILVGYMGAGKSSVAAELGRRLHLKPLDTDARIEELEGCSISMLFKDRGEAYFRDRETALLKKLSEEGFDGILSTGGGMPVREENRAELKKLGKVYYLKASPRAIAERLSHDNSRPLLAGAADLEEKERRIAGMLAERDKYYASCADTVIVTDGLSVKEIADRILTEEKASL